MYYVYILRCVDNSLYTGITTDVKRRFYEHKDMQSKGAKYTRSHLVVSIAAVWEAKNRADASKLESFIKKQTKAKKESFIQNPAIISDIFDMQYTSVPYEI